MIDVDTLLHCRWVVPVVPRDRVLGTRLGVAAGRLVIEKKFGRMVALQGTKVIDVALADAVGKLKTLDPDFLRDAS